ncbi:FecR family protein [Polaromonas sp.]|uniref:FecR family protein n=1 Tax=Polaromonas sp. TaxID=1869339 RepID=UPI00286C7000|nr:FecR family protein [Polaromonas sp.]
MLRLSFKPLQVLAIVAGCAAPAAFANGTFQTVSGDVRASASASAPEAVSSNARIVEGTTVVTGPNGRVTIRLDDGHAVVLPENSEFRLEAYRFNAAAPQSSNIAIRLLKGALRSFSGLIGGRNPGQFALTTSTATVGIRGTDFAVAEFDNQTYVAVAQGEVSLGNSAGSVSAGAGQTAAAASPATLPSLIAAGALPGPVAATFSQLNAVVIATQNGSGAAVATAAAAGGSLNAGVAVGVAAFLAAAIAGGGSGNGATTGTTGTGK